MMAHGPGASRPTPCLMYNLGTRDSEHELGLRTFQLNPGGESIEQRMAREEGEVRARQEKQHGKIIRTLNNMGNGQVAWDVEDAAEKLLTRDFPEVAKITDTEHSGPLRLSTSKS